MDVKNITKEIDDKIYHRDDHSSLSKVEKGCALNRSHVVQQPALLESSGQHVALMEQNQFVNKIQRILGISEKLLFCG